MRKLTKEEFIEKAKQVHGNKYDYSKVEYINSQTKICIICPIHGEFWQQPNNHLQGHGCKDCMKENNINLHKLSIDEFIKRAKQVHGNKYDYSKVEYKGIYEKICIICPKHGEFWQKPNYHINSHSGCPKCANKNKTITDFIEKARQIHNNKYDYSKVEYVNSQTKICIICPKHGEFWQTPDDHLQGKGCSHCHTSKLENSMKICLKNDNIIFEQQKKFEWLGKQSLDFYLPEYNTAIECQGAQHFYPSNYFGGEKQFRLIQERDTRKRNLCEENGVKLLYFADKQYTNAPYKLFIDKSELLKEIVNHET